MYSMHRYVVQYMQVGLPRISATFAGQPWGRECRAARANTRVQRHLGDASPSGLGVSARVGGRPVLRAARANTRVQRHSGDARPSGLGVFGGPWWPAKRARRPRNRNTIGSLTRLVAPVGCPALALKQSTTLA